MIPEVLVQIFYIYNFTIPFQPFFSTFSLTEVALNVVLFLNYRSALCMLKISIRKSQETCISFPVSSINHCQFFFKC